MKKSKALGIIALIAVIGFLLASCPTDGNNGGKPQTGNENKVVPEVVALNVSKISEWDWIVAGADGSSMLFNTDKTTGAPTRVFVKPDKNSDDGFSCTFDKETGLPDVMVNNGLIFVFDNFDGYTFDFAVIYPDGTTEYHYGLETEENFDTWDARFMSGRSVYNGARSASARSAADDEDMDILDQLSVSLDIIGHSLGVFTCITALTNPASAVGCYIYIFSTMAKAAATVILETVDLDWAAGASGLTIDGINLVIDALGCAGKGVQDCISAVGGLASMLIGDDLQTVGSKIAEIYTAKDEMEYWIENGTKVNFHANGGGGTVPAPLTVPSSEIFIRLPSGGSLWRDGYNFIGWSTSPIPNVRYFETFLQTGDPYNLELHKRRNVSFYARWKEILPGIVTGASAREASSSSIRVTWNAVSGAIRYNVYRGMSAYGRYEKVGSSSSTVYWDTELSSNTAYYYKVSYYEPDRPYQPGGESQQSATVFARTMGTTGSNVGTAVTFTGMTANGYAVSDGGSYGFVLAATTELTLTFSAPIYGLTADDITLESMVVGSSVQKGTLSGSGPSYTLGVSGSGFNGPGLVSARVLKGSYNISGTQSTYINFLAPSPGIGTPEMVYVPGGTFQRGKEVGTAGSGDTYPVTNVTLSSFYIGKYPVTQAQWYAVMGTTILDQQATILQGDFGRGARCPMYFVNWYEALVFCNKLSVMEGLTPAYRIKGSTNPDDWGDAPNDNAASDIWGAAVEIVSGSTGYRLPTDAQWEYAAKGGNPLAPGWVGYTFAGSDVFNEVAWGNGNISNTMGVGFKVPNGLGLYDMSGNVLEWCWDLNSISVTDQTNPMGPLYSDNSTRNRVQRGGRWDGIASVARSVNRSAAYPTYRSNDLGFRLARPAH